MNGVFLWQPTLKTSSSTPVIVLPDANKDIWLLVKQLDQRKDKVQLTPPSDLVLLFFTILKLF